MISKAYCMVDAVAEDLSNNQRLIQLNAIKQHQQQQLREEQQRLKQQQLRQLQQHELQQQRLRRVFSPPSRAFSFPKKSNRKSVEAKEKSAANKKSASGKSGRKSAKNHRPSVKGSNQNKKTSGVAGKGGREGRSQEAGRKVSPEVLGMPKFDCKGHPPGLYPDMKSSCKVSISLLFISNIIISFE